MPKELLGRQESQWAGRGGTPVITALMRQDRAPGIQDSSQTHSLRPAGVRKTLPQKIYSLALIFWHLYKKSKY